MLTKSTMNTPCFSSEVLTYVGCDLRAGRGKKGEKKMAVINSWCWGCSQVNLCGSIWPWFGANEQMERVTKTQDSSLPGETHNTFLLSTVIKQHQTIQTHTHTQTHYLLFKGGEASNWIELNLPTWKPVLTRLIVQLTRYVPVRDHQCVCVLYNDCWPIDAFHHDEDLPPGPVGPWLPWANRLSEHLFQTLHVWHTGEWKREIEWKSRQELNNLI